MAREVDSLLLTMSADIRGLKRSLDEANGVFDRQARKMEARQRELDKKFEKLGAGLGRGLAAASLVAAGAFGAIVGYSIKAAASAVELKNAFEVAFGAGAKGADTFAKALSDKVGRSQLDILESMTRFRLLLKDQDATVAEDLTKALQERAIDVGSLFNIKDDQVVQKFFSGLTGESEPLKALGVNLNEAALKAELLRLGFKGNAQAAPEAVKQVARANIILRETQVAAGDAAKTIDSTANRFKKLQGETRDAAAQFGEQFLPIANKVIAWATDALTAFNKLPHGMQIAGLAALGLVAAAGPLAQLALGLSQIIKLAVEARAALIAMAGANAIAGGAAAGGVAAGVAGGSVVGAGAAGATAAAVLSLRGDTVAKDHRSDDQTKLNNLLAREVSLRSQIAQYDAAGAKLRASSARNALEALQTQIHATRLAIGIAGLPGGPGAVPSAIADGTAPQFGLTAEQLKAAAAAGGLGGKGGGGPKGTKNDPVAVDPVTLPEIGRVGGELTPFEQVQAAADAFRRREEAKSEPVHGFDTGSGFEPADQDKVFQDAVEQIAKLKGQAEQDLFDGIHDGILGGLHAAADGHGIDYLKARLRDAILEAATTGLTTALMQALSSQAGTSLDNILSKGVDLVFGHNAGGTDRWRGGMSWVGERGPELVNLPRGAQVIPNSTLRQLAAAPSRGGGGSTTIVQQTLQLTNYGPTTKEFMAEVQRVADRSANRAGVSAANFSLAAMPGRLVQQQKLGR